MSQQKQILDYASKQYGASPEYLWEKYPTFAILRHSNAHNKWFALTGRIAKSKLGLNEEGDTDFLNIKCPPEMVGMLRQDPNFLPAYHMNKEHWLTIVLDNGVATDELLKLLDWSFDLTK